MNGDSVLPVRRTIQAVAAAVAGILLVLALPAGAQERSWDDRDVVRDAFYAWCRDRGWTSPPRNYHQMKEESPDCLAFSIRHTVAFMREKETERGQPGRVVATACAASAASRGVAAIVGADGACVDFPSLLTGSPFDVVPTVRAALQSSDHEFLEAARRHVSGQVAGMLQPQLMSALIQAGFQCGASPTGTIVCRVTVNLNGWKRFEERVTGAFFCSFHIEVLPTAGVTILRSAMAPGYCLGGGTTELESPFRLSPGPLRRPVLDP